MTPPASAYGILLAAQLAVASAALMARAGLADGLSAFSLSAWRLTAASLLLLTVGFARARGRRHEVAAAPMLPLLLAGFLLGLHFAAWFASLERTSVARSTLLVATTPLWTGLAEALLFGRPPPGRFWLGLILAGTGVALITGFGLGPYGLSGHAAEGDALAVLGAIFIAGYLLIAQRLQQELGPARMVTWTYSLAAITLWPVAALQGPAGILPRSETGWLSVLGMALVPQLIGHTAMNWSLRHFSAALVGAATLLEPVFAAGLAWWLLGEPVTLAQAAGGALVLSGVGLALTRGR